LTEGSVTHCTSFTESSPTWAVIKVSSSCESDPAVPTPMLFPFSPATLSIPSLANRSKQPTIKPANNINGSPASIALTH
jgi:hypothetical protein